MKDHHIAPMNCPACMARLDGALNTVARFALDPDLARAVAVVLKVRRGS